jgi:hypothetical protein
MQKSYLIIEREKIVKEVVKEISEEMIKTLENLKGFSLMKSKLLNFSFEEYLIKKIKTTRSKYADFNNPECLNSKIKELYFSKNYNGKIFQENSESIFSFFSNEISCKVKSDAIEWNNFCRTNYVSISYFIGTIKGLKNEKELKEKTLGDILKLFNDNEICIYYSENNRHKRIKNENEFLNKLDEYLKSYFMFKETYKIKELIYKYFLTEFEKRYNEAVNYDNYEGEYNIFGFYSVDNLLLINLAKKLTEEILEKELLV